jgi:hypothetical protein
VEAVLHQYHISLIADDRIRHHPAYTLNSDLFDISTVAVRVFLVIFLDYSGIRKWRYDDTC